MIRKLKITAYILVWTVVSFGGGFGLASIGMHHGSSDSPFLFMFWFIVVFGWGYIVGRMFAGKIKDELHDSQ